MAMDEETPLVVTKSQSQTLNHKRDIHILSWSFLLIFSAYGAAQNLQSTINTEGDLGTTSLGILYVSFMVFAVIASLVVRKIGSKNAMVVGTSGYWLFVAANLKPTWYTMVPASLYLGFAASVIWVGQGTYLTSAAHSHGNGHNLHVGTVIGNFNGEFWGMFALHQFVGNLVSLALLRDGKEGSTSGTTLLFIVFIFIISVGIVLMFFLHKRDDKEEEQLQDYSVSFCSSVVALSKSLITLLFDIRILLIIPLIAYSGLQSAFVWAEFTKYVVKPVLGEPGVGGAMAVFGAFDAICSLAAGRLTSGLTSITLLVSGGAFIHAVALLCLLLYSTTNGVFGTIYPLLMAALWGVGDGVLNTQLSALLGLLFKHDMEGAFAQLKLWQSAATAVVFFMSPFVTLQTMLVIMLAALCISMAAFLFLTLKVERALSP